MAIKLPWADEDATGKQKTARTLGTVGAGILSAPIGGIAAPLGHMAVKAGGKFLQKRKERFNPIGAAKDMLAADVAALEKPAKLGYTDSQIQKRASEAQALSGAQAQGSQADLSRMILGGQAFQAGALTEAQGAVQAKAQEAPVAALAEAHEISRAIQEKEANRIRASLDEARAREKMANYNTSQKALAVVGGLASAVGKIPGLEAFGYVGTGLSAAGEQPPAAAPVAPPVAPEGPK